MGHLIEDGEGRGEQNIPIAQPGAAPGNICRQMTGIKDGGVHLPVSGNQWSSFHNWLQYDIAVIGVLPA
jgi:hypothetical protein